MGNRVHEPTAAEAGPSPLNGERAGVRRGEVVRKAIRNFMKTSVCFILTAFSVSATLLAQTPWQAGKAPLMTRWGKDVKPDQVLPEYPRPQMVRSNWINLNGLWDFDATAQSAEAPKTF